MERIHRILAVLILVAMLSPIAMTETVFAAPSEPPATGRDLHPREVAAVAMIEGAEHTVKTVNPEDLPKTKEAESSRAEVTVTAPSNTAATIEIKGSWWFVNDEGGWSPGRYMHVYLMDDDTFGDETVADQWTNSNGQFDFIVDNDDGFLQGGRDPYLHFDAEGEWDWKTTNSGGDMYHWSSGVLGEDVPDGWVYDIGSISPASDNNALMAGDAVYAEMQWVFDRVGWDRSKVTVRWPREDWPHSHGDYIDLPAAGWDHASVQHEDGHCIMWTLMGNSWPNGWTGGDHWIGMEDTVQNAWTEGWAEFMEAAVDNDPNNLQGNWQNVETNTWFNWVDTGDMDGANIEGEVASILWDINDPVNIVGDDDHLYWGYDEIFTVLRYGDAGVDDNPNSILEFWDDWLSRWPTISTSVGPLCDIYYNYGIDKDWYAPWGTIVINSGATYTTSRTVTLTLSADDWGVGVQYMRFSEDLGVTWGSWYYYATTFSYYITKAGDGFKWIDVQFADYWWTSGAGTIYDGITLDTANPTGSIVVGSGNPTYTTSTSVTLYLTYSDATSGVYQVRYSNDGVWDTETWEAPSATKAWTLTAGDGLKTVYYQVKDNAGQLSPTYSDTITLSTPVIKPSFTIWTDKTVYHIGETMKVYVRVKNPGNATKVRAIIKLQLWNGNYYGPLLDMTTTLPAAFDSGNVLWQQFTLPQVPYGNYTWVAELRDPITGTIISQDFWYWSITP